MTSLEFIEKEIAMVKKKISMAKSKFTIKGLTYYHINEIKEEINILRDRLRVIQQIKSELEAWEIAKNKSVDLYDIKTSQDTEEFNCDLYTEYQLTEEEFNKLKKALEEYDE